MPNVYSNCTTLATGCILYQNSNGTAPVAEGYYFDGTTCWFATVGGVINSSATCPTPTPTATPTATPTPTPTTPFVCSECREYQVDNTTGSVRTLSYWDCLNPCGSPNTTDVEPLGTITICNCNDCGTPSGTDLNITPLFNVC